MYWGQVYLWGLRVAGSVCMTFKNKFEFPRSTAPWFKEYTTKSRVTLKLNATPVNSDKC